MCGAVEPRMGHLLVNSRASSAVHIWDVTRVKHLASIQVDYLLKFTEKKWENCRKTVRPQKYLCSFVLPVVSLSRRDGVGLDRLE